MLCRTVRGDSRTTAGLQRVIEIPGYKILRQLGRGGMATVYLAVQESVQRDVALKVMSPMLLADADFVVLAAPQTTATKHLMSTVQFAAMKRTAYFINVARGALVDDLPE